MTSTASPDLHQRLRALEYAIRQSMPVREDQEDAPDPAHLAEALSCDIAAPSDVSKGELLSLVQTRIRTL